MELPKRYRPDAIESEQCSFWENGGFFRAGAGSRVRVPFSVVIPPPNVTGRLHMGHALNNTLQDIVVRYHRMCGEKTCWFPGTDHAGIATQNVVEKELAREGKSRHDLGREAFVDRVWEWKAKYGSEIIEQLKALGCSCDWSRQRFTLDDGLSAAVREVFVRLYNEQLIYRGAYLVNWCPRCESAISDLEVEHEEVEGAMYSIRYALDDGGFVTIATTRPETMLGDTAIAVHPDDERYRDLVGRTATLPILGRRLPIIAADEVDPTFGSGALKVTPAHDPIDFEIGQKHSLESVNILNGDGTINEHGGPYAGMGREEARTAIVERLREDGLLEGIEPHRHAIGHCERCHTAVEPLISTQWFVRMKPLAERAIEAVRDGRVRFVPERWSKLYFDWMENIRDWCISRQLWWGHRIPVWYGPDGTPFAAISEEEAARAAAEHYGESVALEQDEDVLDTWFSSWLWPFSVMGWPEGSEDLEIYFPTSFLVTAFDIIFFWAARMIMASLHFLDEVPFRTLYITPLIVDPQGRKMSKSKGNTVDPLDFMAEYGADALRFAMAHASTKGRSMRTPTTQLAEARNFLNKIWNMARFVHMQLGEARPPRPEAPTEPEDRYILSRLAATAATARTHFKGFSFNLATEALYAFTWHDVCDWYLELAKPRLAAGDDSVRGVLYHVLKETLKLLHPIIPFITEAIWRSFGEAPESVSLADYPQPEERDDIAESAMGLLQEVVRGARTVRGELHVPADAPLDLYVRTEREEILDVLLAKESAILELVGGRSLHVGPQVTAPPMAARQILRDGELYVPLQEIIDIDVERQRLSRELAQTEKELAAVRSTLDNERFLARAPQEVVEKERGKLREHEDRAARLRGNLEALGA